MFRILGITAGVLSLTILGWQGFDFSFGPLLLGVLEYYEDQAREFFGLIEPLIRAGLANLSAISGLELKLYPHWKHTFVLMWLYFGAGARTTWNLGNKGSAMFVFLWGSFIALVAGAFSGTVVLSSSATSNMMMAFWPIVGVVIYNLGLAAWAATFLRRDGYSWMGYFRHYVVWVTTWIVCPGVIALIIGTQVDKLQVLQDVQNPGLVLLAAFIVYLALRNLYDGARDQSGRGDTRWQRFLNDGDTRTALDMLSVIGFASFIALLGVAGI